MRLPSPVGLSDIKEYIDYGKDLQISQDTMNFKTKFDPDLYNTIVMNYDNIYDEYLEQLQGIIRTYTMSDVEFIKYRYQPKLFCLDIYGYMDISYLILRINNMTSALQFNKKNIYIFSEEIFEYLNEILTLEEPNIIFNKSQVFE